MHGPLESELVPGDATGARGSPPPVLHVLAPAPAGGLERVVRALAGAQAARGQRVTLAAIVTVPPTRAGSAAAIPDADAATLAALAAPGVTVTPVMVPGRGYQEERRQVAAIAERCGAHIAHTHGYRPDVLDAGMLRSRGLPTVTTVHGFTGGGWRNRFYQHLQRRAFRRFDAVVAVSEPMARGLVSSGVSSARLHVVPNAYASTVSLRSREAARASLALPADAYVIGWVGRLSHEKGLDVLLDALAMMLHDRPLTLAVLGDGRERAQLEAQAQRLHIADRVRWLGLVGEAATCYRAFDAFVLSSRTEGTPIALFEAMDALVPVVATAVGGVPGVVSSAEAVLVPREAPAALADGLRAVLSDPSAARQRAMAARERLLTAYGIHPWLAQYDRIYASVLLASGRAGGTRGGVGTARDLTPR
jgi:glycosyltransferase involved in cell wall biosynthesis